MNEKLGFGVISPAEWGLSRAKREGKAALERYGFDFDDLERRILYGTSWQLSQWDTDGGVCRGFYRASDDYSEPPQLVNLIAPWLLLAGYDRFDDEELRDVFAYIEEAPKNPREELLVRAKRSSDWLYGEPEKGVIRRTPINPMSQYEGGVVDDDGNLLKTKFTAEYGILNLGLFARLEDEREKTRYLKRAFQNSLFLLQSRYAEPEFSPAVDVNTREWQSRGWQSFGRVIEFFLKMHELSKDDRWGEYVKGDMKQKEINWYEQAVAWGDYALDLQQDDGCFPLIDKRRYNSDIAADELRALVFLTELTNDEKYLESAIRFADWHLENQFDEGSWILEIDTRSKYQTSVWVSPGDVANIAIGLLRVHNATNDKRYLDSAVKAMHYVLRMQVTPESDISYSDKLEVQWGCWSWDSIGEHFDYTMSGDQQTHVIRGMMFMVDYLSNKT